jgi:hypothetical protein
MSSAKDIIIDEIIVEITNEKIKAAEEDKKRYWSEYIFQHIKTFQDIDCNIILAFGFGYEENPNNFKVVLRIRHNEMFKWNSQEEMEYITLYANVMNRYEKLDRSTISNILDEMKVELQKIKYDKVTNRFSEKVTTIIAHTHFFSDIPSIKMMGEECPVCRENVSTKTICKHILCVPCFQQITEVENEFGDDEKRCPMCREPITYTD